MVKSSIFCLISVIALAKSVVADDPYIPCKSYIGFYYDDSETLGKDQFSTQMNFIKNAIRDLNYPQRLAAEGGYGGEFNWNSKLSISQMQSAIDAAEQTSIPYSLLQQFSSLATNFENLNDYSNRFGVLIFISDTSDDALRNADRLFPKLKGIRITFVLLGNNVDSSKLRNFSSNFLYWPDLTQPAPDNWDLVSYHAYGCDAPDVPSSTVKSSTTLFTSTTTTPAPGSYYPCQNWITVLIDNSNALTADYFQKQLNFTKTILSQVTHVERIRYGAYNAQRESIICDWNPNNDQQGLQAAIDATNRTAFGPSILKAIQALLADENQNRTTPDATLIFVTDTSNPTAILQAVDLYNTNLKSIGVKLTFILVGQNTNGNALEGFDDAIIYNWQNIGFFSQPDGWDLATALRCKGIPATTIAPYFPCQSWIYYGIDDSKYLSSKDFKTQMAFISSAIGELNYPYRLDIQGDFTAVASWNNNQTITQMQTELSALYRANSSYSLLQQFGMLLTDYETIQHSTKWPIGALIFISDTSDHALLNANIYFPKLAGIRITFVLLGPNADQSKLTNFTSNFIYWSDLSQPQPDNWDNSYYAAYGCQ